MSVHSMSVNYKLMVKFQFSQQPLQNSRAVERGGGGKLPLDPEVWRAS